MKVFSDNVADANNVIASSVEEFVTEMPKLAQDARIIGDNLSEFNERFDQDMKEVKGKTESFQGLVNQVLETTEQRSNGTTKFSTVQTALCRISSFRIRFPRHCVEPNMTSENYCTCFKVRKLTIAPSQT